MRRYAAVTDATLRVAMEAVSGNEAVWAPRREPGPPAMDPGRVDYATRDYVPSSAPRRRLRQYGMGQARRYGG